MRRPRQANEFHDPPRKHRSTFNRADLAPANVGKGGYAAVHTDCASSRALTVGGTAA